MATQTRAHVCRWFLALLVGAVLVPDGLAGPSKKTDPRRPNVIVILTDDQGYGDLGCHGNPVIKTPNLDRLFKQSIRLKNFHVDPTCSPTRSALMTGRYSSRTGVWHTVMGRSLLRRDEVTLADVFAANGYRTGLFGKWHLGDNAPYRPQERGFHEVLTFGGGGIGNTPDVWGNNYFDDTLRRNGELHKVSGYCTDVFFAAALQFIERNRAGPFLAYIAPNAPHAPFNVSEKYSKPYRDCGVPEQRARFYGMITNIDENVGRLLERLRALGLEENTIVVFMTDNGTSMGYNVNTGDGYNAGMRGFKGSEYDGGHRVPCFIRWPGHLPAGKDVLPITAHIDVLPTLIDLCGLKKPAKVTFDGVSLRPLLTGKGDWPARTLLVHSQRMDHPEKWRKCAVMTDRWRLVNGKELYDMTVDPGQKKDVAAAHAPVVAELRRAYEHWWADIGTRFGEYCEIALGSAKENPTMLCCHDWHGERALSLQDYVRNEVAANGFWAVDVTHAGKYEITLRHQPAAAKFPIRAQTARLSVGEIDVRQAIPAEATAVTFAVALKAGKTRLQTWFTDSKGVSKGAYFVEVKYLQRPQAAVPAKAPPDRAALRAFAQEPLRFESFCFSGDRFPACDFAHPERVKKLIGPYTLKVIWYNADSKVVTAPKKEAGRYAAVVEIRHPGRVSKRFFTLYHLAGKARWSVGAAGATLELPKGTAIDPEIVRGQGEDVDALVTRAVSDMLKKEPAGAALLAGLDDLTRLRRAGRAADDDRASYRERQWWVDFRRRYYGYDKLNPNRFVCPRPLEGKPAAVVRDGTLAAAGMKPGAAAAIDAACAAWLKENDIGFGLCVVRKGVVVLNKGYGRYQGKAVTAATPCVLASLTKFLCAILLLEMVDQGLLDLDDPVEKHVPALRGVAVERSMTIRDLYLHTCGLTGHDGDTWPDLEEVVADLYPALEVGVRHQYQGMGHALASKIMETMSGEALPYLYRNHLFRPLGCTHTRAEFSAYGSWSVPIELARIGQLMLNGGSYGGQRFFGPQTLAKMLPVPGKDRLGSDRSIRWGVGIKQPDTEGLSARAFGHSGASGSFLVIDPERQLVIAHTRMSEGRSYKGFLQQKARLIAAVVAQIDAGE